METASIPPRPGIRRSKCCHGFRRILLLNSSQRTAVKCNVLLTNLRSANHEGLSRGAVVELRRVGSRGLSHDVLAFPFSDQAPVDSSTGPLSASRQTHLNLPRHPVGFDRTGK